MSKQKSVWHAENEIKFIAYLRDQIAKLTDDEQAIRDTLEGELEDGKVDDIMNTLLHERAVALEIAEARRALAAKLSSAAAASDAYADRLKGIIADALHAASREDWKGVMGSVYFASGTLKVDVEPGAPIPVEFYKPVLDKALLNKVAKERQEQIWAIRANVLLSDADREAAIAAINQIEGVSVYRGDPVLNIREPKGKP